MKYLALLLLSGISVASAGAQSLEAADGADAPVQLTLDQSFTKDLRLAQVTDPEEKVKPDIHYVPTPAALVDVMLRMAKVNKDDLLYDLGSGDGRLVITAASKHGARGIGIDIDPQRIAEAKENAAAAKVEDKVEFRQQDLFKSNFKDASVITLYLLEELNRRLRPQLFAQVKPGTRIVSHAFTMGDWDPDAEETLKIDGGTYNAYFWVVPANMSGRWKVSGRGAAKGIPETVTVEQSFQKITVRAGEGEGGGEVVGEGKLTGSDFTFTMRNAEGAKPLTFTGKVDGNSIKATGTGSGSSWTAEREAGTEKPLDPPPDGPAASES